MKDKLTIKNIICLILVLAYFAGLILMIIGDLSRGIGCWVVSTIGGAAALAVIKGREERAEARAQAATASEPEAAGTDREDAE